MIFMEKYTFANSLYKRTENNLKNYVKNKFWGILCLADLKTTTESTKYYRYVDPKEFQYKNIKMSIDIQLKILSPFFKIQEEKKVEQNNCYAIIIIDKRTNHMINSTSNYKIMDTSNFNIPLKKVGGRSLNENYFYIPNGLLNDFTEQLIKHLYTIPKEGTEENARVQKSSLQKTSLKNSIEEQMENSSNDKFSENSNKEISKLIDKEDLITKRILELQKRRKELKEQCSFEEEKLKDLKKQIEVKFREMRQAENEKYKLDTAIKRLEIEKKTLEDAINKIKEEKVKIDQDVNNLLEYNLKLEEEKNDLENKINELSNSKNNSGNGRGYNISTVRKIKPDDEIRNAINSVNPNIYKSIEDLNKKITEGKLEYGRDIADFIKILKSENKNYSLEKLKFIYNSTINTNRLTILMGNPGFGKSSMVREFVRIFNKTRYGREDLFNLCFIPVSPEWIDPSYVLGAFNYLTSEPEITDFVKTIYLAEQFPKVDFFIIFDEFNIARPENYFAPFLSLLELPNEDANRKIKIWSKNTTNDNKDFYIKLNNNIHFLATINEDSTTYELSPKVKDRSDIIILYPSKEEYDKFIDELKIEKSLKIVLKDLVELWHNNFSEIIFSYRVLNSLTQLNDNIDIDNLLTFRLFNNIPYQIDSQKFEKFVKEFKRKYEKYYLTAQLLQSHLEKLKF